MRVRHFVRLHHLRRRQVKKRPHGRKVVQTADGKREIDSLGIVVLHDLDQVPLRLLVELLIAAQEDERGADGVEVVGVVGGRRDQRITEPHVFVIAGEEGQ